MKRITAPIGLILIVLFFSCKKENVTPDVAPIVSNMPVSSTTTNKDTSNTTGTTSPAPVVNKDTTKANTTAPATGTTTTTPVSGTTTTGSKTTTTPATGTTTPATGTTTTTTPVTGTTTTKTGPVAATGTTTGTKTTTTPATSTPTATPTTGTTTTTAPATSGATNTTPATNLTGVYGDGIHDDTRALQALLNAGNVTLASGKIYKVTGLSIGHTLNMNGSTINVTSLYGYPVRMVAAGASITNGIFTGTWNNTQPENPNGAAGLYIAADNCSVSHVTIASFAAYGILVGPANNTSVTYCVLKNIGYIAFYFDAESAITSGGIFSYNTVDRSMLPASTVTQIAVGIRGSTSNASITTSNWTINGNVIKMPYNPSSMAAECMEVRYMTNSIINGNTFINGSIGCSVVRSSGITVSSNAFSGSTEEALEFADTKLSSSQNNKITSSGGVGVLVDGGVGSSGITIGGDVISGTPKECIHAYTNTTDITITGCTLTASSGAKAINLQGTSQVKIQNTIFKGNGVGAIAVMLDTCPGNLTMTGGSVSNFSSCVMSIYNAKAGMVTNNVTASGVTVTGVPRILATVLQNGGLLGTNIVVKL